MLTKLAGLVLAGSILALAIGGITGATERERHRHALRDAPRIEHRIKHQIRREAQLERHRIRIERRADHIARRLERLDRLRPELPAVAGRGEANAAGTYIFDANGNPFGKLPWNAHLELELQREGRYELRVATKIADELEEETSWGRYRVDGDRVTLYSAHDGDTHELRIDGDRLTFDTDWSKRLALKAVGVDQMYFTRQP